jgi:aspartate/methionine/tyrosine aminotransferase
MIKKADRLNQVGEYYFSTKLAEIARLRAEGKDILNLGIGSPDLAPADAVVEELVNSAANKENHAYQPYRSTLELRQAISHYYNKVFNVELDPEHEVLPLLGSKEGVMYISLAFLNPGDEVLVPDPGYPAYGSIAQLLGASVSTYDLNEGNGWLPDFRQLAARDLSKVKLMWVNYPHMPTGTPATDKLFDDLAAFAKSNNILICNDNPYSLVLNDRPKSILNYDPDRTHAIELNSLSKSFNMAGWRVGMVMGHQQYINAIIQAKSNVDSGMFLPVQHAAIQALELPLSWHDNRNEIYAGRREIVVKILNTIGCAIENNQVGMFLWARVPDQITNTRQLVDNLLQNAHIFITPGEIFGKNGSRYVRMSLTSPIEIYEEALKRVVKWQESQTLLA